MCELAAPATNSLDNVGSRTDNQAKVERGLGAVAAVLTWLAWLAICPALGFPTLAPVAMVNRAFFGQIVEAGREPGFWLGWVIVIAGLVLAIGVFFVVERTDLVGMGVRNGVIYGAVLWLFAGVVVMPLLRFAEPSSPFPAHLDPMQPTLMMNSLGPLAALAALIAWVLFGAILGATGRVSQ
jgi:hypothetical protein